MVRVIVIGPDPTFFPDTVWLSRVPCVGEHLQYNDTGYEIVKVAHINPYEVTLEGDRAIIEVRPSVPLNLPTRRR